MIKTRRSPRPSGVVNSDSVNGLAPGRCWLAWPGRLAVVLLLLLATLPATALAVPTVNGLFYADGDSAEYVEWSTSYYGSKLYVHYDLPTTTIYVALVVDRAVNDNVFGASDPGFPGNYMVSAGWGAGAGQQRSALRLTDSEFAAFELSCIAGTSQDWAWQQGYACITGGVWVSDSTCGTSIPGANGYPPSLQSASSFAWNLNNYEAKAPGPYPWDMYVFGPTIDDWKSPFSATDPLTVPPNNPNTVIGLEGFPAAGPISYNSTYEWEWPMVYEWSVNLTTAGCGANPVTFLTGLSHHSPLKAGLTENPLCPLINENDCFPPGSGDPLSDFGDLPDSYGTLLASGGAQHYLTTSGPYLGSALDMEIDGNPNATASGDDGVGTADEEGVTANVTSNWTVGSTQTLTVVSSGTGVLAAWFDWNGDGSFDASEYVTMAVVAGSNTLSVTVGSGFDWQSDTLAARFRLFSSSAAAPGGSLDSGDFTGVATDGEVEDYVFSVGALPVTLNAFSTEVGAGGAVTARWQTATETDNVGFEILGLVDGEWRPLSELVPTAGMNSELPQDYEVELHLSSAVTALELVDYDTRGRPERFGPFKLGASYGEVQAVERLDWTGPRARRLARLRARGFTDTDGTEERARWKKTKGKAQLPRRNRPGNSPGAVEVEVESSGKIRFETGPLTHVAVTKAGVQRVSYEALRDAGLDLAGANSRDIAVTWRGAPVARSIEGRGPFGPGGAIEFVGRPPQGDDALYVDAALYQVSLDPSRALEARRSGRGSARRAATTYDRESTVDHPVLYHRQSPTGDPWVERSLLVRAGAATATLEIPVEGPVLPGPSRLSLGLGTVTDLPDMAGAGGEVLPEHNVEVWFAGPGSKFSFLTSASTSGQQDWRIEAAIPDGALATGTNRVQLRFHTDYFFSLVLIDTYGVTYPAPLRGPQLDFARVADADGYRIEGFGSPRVVAYAEHEDGSLTRMDAAITPSGGGFAAELRKLQAARFWVTESPHTPTVFTTEAAGDLLSRPADLVVVADSSFIGSSALEDYLAGTSDFSPVVVDVEDIYNAVGFGMALPAAITDYLKARDAVHPFSHVQLVGTDCYDRLNRISECVSFIPLPTARVGVTTYSPSQNRLVDLDGDGVGDKAIGQFSVRDEAELATIVSKGADWRRSGLATARSVLMIAEETDGIHDFRAQVERLQRDLGWGGAAVLDMSEHPDVETAKESLRASLDQGQTVTVFSGHSSPHLWAFRSLLTAAEVESLTNSGLPTIMVPLACEATYDVSPNANVLGHQLLYAGEQGALAISGAVALSSLGDNELMATFVLDGLKSGLTLGEAVQAGRAALGTDYQTLQNNWATQGDVTTRLAP